MLIKCLLLISKHFLVYLIKTFSEQHFEAIKDAIESDTNKHVDIKAAIELFKKNLYDKIQRKFITNWNELELNPSLKCLEFSKKLSKIEEKKWRPSNVRAEEQANPAVAKVLENRKRILEHQIEFQNQKIEQLVPILEERRHILKNQVSKREHVLALMEGDREKMKTVEEQIVNVNLFLKN